MRYASLLSLFFITYRTKNPILKLNAATVYSSILCATENMYDAGINIVMNKNI